jgi:alpha-tubulin suppressor-like RCC1 family protein
MCVSNHALILIGGLFALCLAVAQAYTVPAVADVDLAQFHFGSGGFRLAGENSGDRAGIVSSAGDFNGDGFADILIGAPGLTPQFSQASQAGGAVLIYGTDLGLPTVQNLTLADIYAEFDSVRIRGSYPGGLCGFAVTNVGRFNVDDYDDIAISCPGEGVGSRGVTYVVFGPTSAAFTLSMPWTYNGFKVLGSEDYERSGSVLAVAGDVNGDGYSDFMIGSMGHNSNAGCVYVVFGGNYTYNDLYMDDNTTYAGHATRIYASNSSGSMLGFSLCNGDFNGDGYLDIALGAPYAQGVAPDYVPAAGRVYVLWGVSNFTDWDPIGEGIDVAYLMETGAGLLLHGVAENETLGYIVANAGLFNHDYSSDLIAHAPCSQVGSVRRSVAYVLYGRENFNSGAVITTDDIQFDPELGFSIVGTTIEAWQEANITSIAGVRDQNGDHFDDIAIVSVNGTQSTTYVVYSPFPYTNDTAAVSLEDFISGYDGHKIMSPPDLLLDTVAPARDYNGDNRADILFSGPLASVEGRDEAGMVYLILANYTMPDDSELYPSVAPAEYPSVIPSEVPSAMPSEVPSVIPAAFPSVIPAEVPSAVPFAVPFAVPSAVPSTASSDDPSAVPSAATSTVPSAVSSALSSTVPVSVPSAVPSATTSAVPSAVPSTAPTTVPFPVPSPIPIAASSAVPSAVPSAVFFTVPSAIPSALTSTVPSTTLSSGEPAPVPSAIPSAVQSGSGSPYAVLSLTSTPMGYPTPTIYTHPPVTPGNSYALLVRASKTYKVQNLYAFAALNPHDNTTFAWGAAKLGGNISTVDASMPLTRIVPSTSSFLGVTSTGGLLGWGMNSSIAGWTALAGATDIIASSVVANGGAYAGLTTSGAVFAVGSAAVGGNVKSAQWSNGFASQLSSGVRSITASDSSFAALTTSGDVYVWGSKFAGGGLSTETNTALARAASVFATATSFACLKTDGTVTTFGDRYTGGDASTVADQLQNVIHIVGSKSAFAAFRSDRTLVTWGHPTRGGDSSAVASLLSGGIVHVTHNDMAFAALRVDGGVATWGEATGGGNSSAVQSQLYNVRSLHATGKAFAALTAAGRVVTWGDESNGGVIPSNLLSELYSGVKAVFSTRRAFAALKGDGSVHVWGNTYQGGAAYEVAGYLSAQVNALCANEAAFMAFKADGTVVVWGHMTVLGITGGAVVAQNPAYADIAQCA